MSTPDLTPHSFQYALRHPTGRVDEVATATKFGPTSDFAEAQRWLAVAQSDCLCSDEPSGHTLVFRVVVVTGWTVMLDA